MRGSFVAALAAVAIATSAANAQQGSPFDGLTRRDGLLTVHADPAGGKVLLTLPAPAADGTIGTYIYAIRITSGVGSNPLGLDRGLGDSGRLLTFRRIGARVIAEIENTEYRANSDDPAERRAVAESFARSIIWSGEIVATTDGRPTVDIGSFVTRDAFYLATHLAGRDPGELSPRKPAQFSDRERARVPGQRRARGAADIHVVQTLAAKSRRQRRSRKR